MRKAVQQHPGVRSPANRQSPAGPQRTALAWIQIEKEGGLTLTTALGWLAGVIAAVGAFMLTPETRGLGLIALAIVVTGLTRLDQAQRHRSDATAFAKSALSIITGKTYV